MIEKYEYKVHYFGHMNFQSGLNELGEAGWKLVQFSTTPAMPGEQPHYLCVFIRENVPNMKLDQQLLNEVSLGSL